MTPKIDVYVGAPIEIESERRFLARLCADLKARQLNALVFANFLVPPHKPLNQVDFLVILDRLVCHVELKNITAPVMGGANGVWHLSLPNGEQQAFHCNPYRQALDCKYAISDQMHRFAKKRLPLLQHANNTKFYKKIDSVVCIYPTLLSGSRVPSDVRVSVRGYPELLDHLANQSISPGWTMSDWTLFAMDMGLMRQEEFSGPPDATASAVEMIQGYCERFREYQKDASGFLVPTTVENGEHTSDSVVCFSFIETNRHGQFVGPSGSGKSLHVRQMALQSLGEGRVSIFLRAIDYAGKLSSLLDRSVAHLCPRVAKDVIDNARRLGHPITFVVDGFNECPAHLKESLLRDLHAAYHLWRIPIIFTTQEAIPLPKDMTGEVIRFREPNKEEREAILSNHAHVPLPPNVEKLCAPFRSAYELSLAGSCLSEIDSAPSRPGLFAAYVRRRCGDKVRYNRKLWTR